MKKQNSIAMQFENENSKIEWAISFDGINPKEKDFFVMNSEKEAILLSERINKI